MVPIFASRQNPFFLSKVQLPLILPVTLPSAFPVNLPLFANLTSDLSQVSCQVCPLTSSLKESKVTFSILMDAACAGAQANPMQKPITLMTIFTVFPYKLKYRLLWKLPYQKFRATEIID